MGKFANVPTVTVRRALGIQARRAGAYQACIGGKMKNKVWPKPAVGTGGRNNVDLQNAFVAAAMSCKTKSGGAPNIKKTTVKAK